MLHSNFLKFQQQEQTLVATRKETDKHQKLISSVLFRQGITPSTKVFWLFISFIIQAYVYEFRSVQRTVLEEIKRNPRKHPPSVFFC